MHFEDICLPLAAHIVQNWRGGLICCHVLWNLHLVARLCKVGSSRTLSQSPAASSRKCGVSCVPLALPAKTFSPADWPWLQVCCSAEESGVQVRRSDGHQWAKARPDQNTSYGCIHWWIEQLLQLCAVFHLATAPKQTLLQSTPWGMLTNPPYASQLPDGNCVVETQFSNSFVIRWQCAWHPVCLQNERYCVLKDSNLASTVASFSQELSTARMELK